MWVRLPGVHGSVRPQLAHELARQTRRPAEALVEAAQHAPTGGGPLRACYERIAKRRGKQVAKVAVARKILTLCYYGLRDGEIRCLAPRAKPRTIRPTAVTTATRPENAVATSPDGEQRQLERARVLSMASPRPQGD